MLPDSLQSDLHDHLYWWLREGPPGTVRWVMDLSWLNECRKCDPYGGPAFWNIDVSRNVEAVLGLPVDIREADEDDRPGWMWRVPHLEEAP